MSPITTHVLDTAQGRPADGVGVVLERAAGANEWQTLGAGHTDLDGRLKTLLPDGGTLLPGTYRLVFDTARYFTARGVATFYPQVVVVFEAAPGETHYHVPLLVSPFGFTTYRGT
jgi:5-hydroxyisourate hydrolase